MSSPSAVESIFLAALENGSPQERSAFLDAACGADAELRRRIERLLDAHARAGDFLEPAAERTDAHVPAGEQVGAVIAGCYKLLEQIGEGGMGTVWVAEQTQPVRRSSRRDRTRSRRAAASRTLRHPQACPGLVELELPQMEEARGCRSNYEPRGGSQNDEALVQRH
jgi:hypothetical protein